MAKRKKKRMPYYAPKIIGVSRQVVALRLPANPDPMKAAEARRQQRIMANTISSPWA